MKSDVVGYSLILSKTLNLKNDCTGSTGKTYHPKTPNFKSSILQLNSLKKMLQRSNIPSSKYCIFVENTEKMRLTIEIGNPLEIEQLLHVFKTMNLESIHIVVDKGVNTKAKKEDSMTDLLKSINRPIKKKLDLNLLKKAKNYNGVNRERFNKLVKEINIVEPIELLLSQLSR